jgi:hypothetical protein
MTVRAGAAALLLAATVVGCDDASAPETFDIRAWLRWNDVPASTADIGFEANVELSSLPGRPVCARISPELRVTINDREAESLGVGGDCQWNVTFRLRGIVDDGPIAIGVFDGDRSLAEARFSGAFPGAQSRLVTPTDGRVAAGSDVVVSVPAHRSNGYTLAEFYWRDVPPNVPAFFTPRYGDLAPDGLSATVQAPNTPGLAGRAALVFLLGDWTDAVTESCVGFGFYGCSLEVALVAGPFDVEVLPAPAP